MRSDDVELALKLCRIAGWNQMRADIVRLLDYEPEGCFIAEQREQPVGTVSTTRYGTDLGWIGLMLVDPDYRRQGVATALMETALQYLTDRKVRCIRLDATPAGQPVYERLGFEAEAELHRWERAGPERSGAERWGSFVTEPGEPAVTQDGNVPTGVSDALLSNALLELDAEAFGTNRARLVRQFATDSLVVTENADDGGFGMARPGTRCGYIGPVISHDELTASRLVDRLLEQLPNSLFWDIPAENAAAVELAESHGFERTRTLTRMWTGRHLPARLDLQYALADPTCG